MIRIRVRADTSIGEARMLLIMRRLGNLAPVLKGKVYQLSLAMIRSHIESGGQRFGQPFAPLKPATLREKLRLGFGGKGILRRTDRLIDSLTRSSHAEHVLKVTPMSIDITTQVPYAEPHAKGSGSLPVRKPVPDPLPKHPFMAEVRAALKTYLVTGRYA